MKKSMKTALFGLLVLIGTLIIGSFTGLIQGGNLAGYLFLGFLALIIVCQIAPALVLFGVLVKEIVHPAPKEEESVKVSANDGH